MTESPALPDVNVSPGAYTDLEGGVNFGYRGGVIILRKY